MVACAAEAIAHAHAQWSHSRSEVAALALPHCQTQAIAIETSHSLAASTLSPGQQAAIHELERRVSHLLHDTLHGTFRLVSAPAGLPMPLTEARGWRRGGLSTLDSLLTMAGNSQLTFVQRAVFLRCTSIFCAASPLCGANKTAPFCAAKKARPAMRYLPCWPPAPACARPPSGQQTMPCKPCSTSSAAGLARQKLCRTATRP